jgi:hypothetical protein
MILTAKYKTARAPNTPASPNIISCSESVSIISPFSTSEQPRHYGEYHAAGYRGSNLTGNIS